MLARTTASEPPILAPLAVLALGTIVAFLVAINNNFDHLAHLWTQCSSSRPKLPTALCFAVLFFQTALDSTRSRLEEAVIIGFLAGLSTITAVESTRCERALTPAHSLGIRNESKGLSNGKSNIMDQGSSKQAVSFCRRVVSNVALPWLLYNLAAGALAWQAIIIPAFLHERHTTAGRTTTTPSEIARLKASECISIMLGVALGLLAPSTWMIINPDSTTTILFWLVFPVWVSLTQRAVQFLVQRAHSVSSDTNSSNDTSLASMIAPYSLPVIYSAVAHFLLFKNLFTKSDDRGPLTRSAVLLLEIDHLAIFAAFLYWVWANTVMSTTRTTTNVGTGLQNRSILRSSKGLQVVLITVLSSIVLGPGAGVCLGWVFGIFHEHDEDGQLSRPCDCWSIAIMDDDQDDKDAAERQNDSCSSSSNGISKVEKNSVPGTPITRTEGRARARSSPKATGHFFGGPLAD